MAKPFAYVAHTTGEVEIRVTQFDTGVINGHLAVGITELNGRNMYRFGQALRDVHFTGLEVDFQSRVPLEKYVLFSCFVPRSHFERQ